MRHPRPAEPCSRVSPSPRRRSGARLKVKAAGQTTGQTSRRVREGGPRCRVVNERKRKRGRRERNASSEGLLFERGVLIQMSPGGLLTTARDSLADACSLLRLLLERGVLTQMIRGRRGRNARDKEQGGSARAHVHAKQRRMHYFQAYRLQHKMPIAQYDERSKVRWREKCKA